MPSTEPIGQNENYEYPAELRGYVEMLAEMGFQLTLCQKAIGKFGEDMEAAVAWLTSGQAQEVQHRMHRSPSWQLAEDLAQATTILYLLYLRH